MIPLPPPRRREDGDADEDVAIEHAPRDTRRAREGSARRRRGPDAGPLTGDSRDASSPVSPHHLLPSSRGPSKRNACGAWHRSLCSYCRRETEPKEWHFPIIIEGHSNTPSLLVRTSHESCPGPSRTAECRCGRASGQDSNCPKASSKRGTRKLQPRGEG